MNVNLPPALFYGIGLMLVVFGALRAYVLGWKRRPGGPDAPPAREGEEPEAVHGRGPRRQPDHKRHVTFGVLWIAMGLFLIVSTIINSRRGF
jgi:hypothetical protein